MEEEIIRNKVEKSKGRFSWPAIRHLLPAIIGFAVVFLFLIIYIFTTVSENQIPIPPPEPPLPQLTDEISSWRTYRVEGLYELKIPEDKFSVKNESYSADVFPGIILSESRTFVSNFTFKEGRPPAGNYNIRVVVIENNDKFSTVNPKELFINLNSSFCVTEASQGNPIKEILLGNIEAYRMDVCSSGLAGVESQIIAVNDDRVIEVIVEPSGGAGLAKQYIEKIFSTFKFIDQQEQVFCTQDAKLCPDGVTYVSREGPNCEFAQCPGN